MATFAEIQDEIRNMLNLADDLTPEQQETMSAYLDELGIQEAEKIDSFASFVKSYLSFADYCRQEAAKLTKRARAVESKIMYMKDYYLRVMNEHNLKKIAGNVYSLSLRRSESVNVTSPDLLTREFQNVKIEPNKTAIKDAIKSGKVVPGAELQDNVSLQIKIGY